MSNVIRDLWPDDIKSEETVSPQTILEYQAEQLAKRTNGMLSAHVVRSVAEDRVVLGFEVKSLIAGSRVLQPLGTFLRVEGGGSQRILLKGNDLDLAAAAVSVADKVPANAVRKDADTSVNRAR